MLVNPPIRPNAATTLKDVGGRGSRHGDANRGPPRQHQRRDRCGVRSLRRERPDALFVARWPLLPNRRFNSPNWRHATRMPAIYPMREFAEAGGLMSYGAELDGCVSSGRRLRRPHSQGREARRTCRSCRRPSSSWSSTSRPRRRSASTFHRSLLAIADEVIE